MDVGLLIFLLIMIMNVLTIYNIVRYCNSPYKNLYILVVFLLPVIGVGLYYVLYKRDARS